MGSAPHASATSLRSYLTSFALFAALFLSPLWIFLRFHTASLFSSHALGVGLGLVVCAGLLAGLAEIAAWLRALWAAAALVFFVELQSNGALAVWQLGLVGGAGAAIAFGLRNHWTSLGPVALVFLASSALLPVGAQSTSVDAPTAPSVARGGPPILHLVLDEQIGVEGIPLEFDADGAAARALARTYEARGFRVFTRAYSRHLLSRDSFSAMFNRGEATRYAGSSRRVFLARNYLFADLAQRGYELRVVQTDYLDLCEVQRDFAISRCRSFALETPAVLDSADLGIGERIRLLFGMWVRLSPRLPAPSIGRVSPLAASAALDLVAEEIAQLRPGVALFAHVMLPHFPYAYDRSCELRPDPSSWAYGAGAEVDSDHYSAAGRRLRYPLYLEQVACTNRRVAELLDALAANPEASDAWVVVQGDHGSRIATQRPSTLTAKHLTAVDLTDAYSTLFAVRKPSVAPGYDRRMLPIEALLPRAMSSESIPATARWMQPPYVELADRRARKRHPLPEFERGDALGPALD